MFDGDLDRAMNMSHAVEFFHNFSLMHDDIMDDADLRRGSPSVHRQFDEATAILAGDALLTLAFDILSDKATHPEPEVRCQLIAALSKAAGLKGMVGGQMLDMIAETEASLSEEDLHRLQRKKTGALICFSCVSGAILAKAPDKERQSLWSYGQAVGLAFQIRDDILDVTSLSLIHI